MPFCRRRFRNERRDEVVEEEAQRCGGCGACDVLARCAALYDTSISSRALSQCLILAARALGWKSARATARRYSSRREASLTHSSPALPGSLGRASRNSTSPRSISNGLGKVGCSSRRRRGYLLRLGSSASQWRDFRRCGRERCEKLFAKSSRRVRSAGFFVPAFTLIAIALRSPARSPGSGDRSGNGLSLLRFRDLRSGCIRLQ